MKTNLISKLMILSGVCVLSACSGKGGDNNTANAVGPQGRIMSLNSQNTYCDISAGTISCTSQNQETGQMCKTQQKLYNTQDMGSFCQKIHELKYESLLGYGACDASSALDRIMNENCKGIATPGMPNPVPNNPGNPNPGYPNPNPGYPGQPGCPNAGCGPVAGHPGYPMPIQPIAFMNCDIRINDGAPVRFPLAMGGAPSSAEYKLKPSGFFGMFKKSIYKVYLKYNPSNHGNRTMYIKVTHNDKKRKVLIEQTGSASQPISLSALDNGDMVSVSCAGVAHGREEQVARDAQKTNLVCHGFSDTLSGGGRPEPIDVNKPLNQILEGEELQLTSAVRVVIDKSKLNITYKALLDDSFGPDLQATSSLKSPAFLISSEGLSKATVQCSLK